MKFEITDKQLMEQRIYALELHRKDLDEEIKKLKASINSIPGFITYLERKIDEKISEALKK